MKTLLKFTYILVISLSLTVPVLASGPNFNDTTQKPLVNGAGNLGIGTTLSVNGLDVATNVAIGTAYAGYQVAPSNGLIVQGNVGIGSLTPGQLLDVQGTARMTGFTLTGNGVGSGYVLTSNNVGVGTWMPASGGGSLWATQSTTDQSLAGGNVGIGTTNTTTAALTVMNGNVGIGTWKPGGSLIVQSGNVGIGSFNPSYNLDIYNNAPSGTAKALNIYANDSSSNTSSFNVISTGISMSSEGASLTFNGSGISMERIAGGSFNVDSGVTLEDSNAGEIGLDGDGNVFAISGGGTISFNTAGGNGTNLMQLIPNTMSIDGSVGIGTTGADAYYDATPPAGSMVMKGNLGIGTFSAKNSLIVATGNVGIGSLAPGGSLDVGPTGTICLGSSCKSTWPSGGANYWNLDTGGNVGINTVGYNVGIGTTLSTNALDVAANVSIGTAYAGYKTAPTNGLIVQGNMGIGTWVPGGALSVMNGNVGIGINNPIANLQIENNQDNIAPTMIQLSNTGTGSSTGATIGFPYGSISNAYSGLTFSYAGAASGTMTLSNTTLAFSGTNFDFNSSNSGNVEFFNTGGSGGLTTFQGPGDILFNSYSLSLSNYFTPMIIKQSGNVGIGTMAPQGGFVVINGNVGIGTWKPGALLDVSTGGQIGAYPSLESGAGNAYIQNDLEVDGTAYLTDATIGTLTVTGGGGITLSGGSTFDHLTVTGNTFLATTSGNVGIGTTTPVGGLAVMNGNVGIGTWVPSAILTVAGNTFGQSALKVSGTSTLDASGPDYSITTNGDGSMDLYGLTVHQGGITVGGAVIGITNGGGYVQSGGVANTFTGNTAFTGNVGIGTSLTPKNGIDIATNVSIGTAYAGYKAAPSNGLIIQGNVGIGTWVPGSLLNIEGGNVGIGSVAPGGSLDVGPTGTICLGSSCKSTWPSGGANYWSLDTGGNVGINTVGYNVGIGTTLSANALDVAANISIGTAYAGYKTAPTNGLIVQGNVGIGTWTTLNALDVNGAAAHGTYAGKYAAPTSGLIVSGNVGVGTYLPDGTFTAGDQVLEVIGSNVGIGSVSPGATLDINGSFRTNGNTGNTTLNTTGGNVGIGSATPGALLDVAGTIRGNQVVDTGVAASNLVYTNSSQQLAAVTLGGGLTLSSGTLSDSGAGNYWLNDSGNVGISTTYAVGIGTTFVGGTGEASLAVMNGNVGIGTWVPGALFAVGPTSNFNVDHLGNVTGLSFSGSTGISTAGAAAYAYTPSSASSPWPYAGDNLASVVSMLNFSPLDSAGSFSEYYMRNTAGNVQIAYVGAISNTGSGVYSPSIVFGQQTGANAYNERMRIDQNGNVGIGTWVPKGTLDVGSTGTICLGGTCDSSWPGGGSNYWNLDTGGNVGINTVGYNVGIGTTLSTNALDVAASVSIGTTYAGYKIASANGLAVQGNVGIGTWGPTSALAVSGSVEFGQIGPMISASSNGLAFGSGTGNTNGISISATGGGSQAFGYALNTGSTTDITSNGEGTLAFGYANGWNITSGTNAGSFAGGYATSGNITASGNGSFAFGNGVVASGTLSTAFGSGFTNAIGSSLMVGYSSTPSFTVNGSNVGIGTTLPSQALEIGNQKVDINSSGNIGIGTIAPTGAIEIEGGNVGIGTAFTTTSALTVMRGNVGIGTWVPGSNLVVNNEFSFGSLYNAGNSSTAITINWSNGNLQKVAMTGNCTFTLNTPNSPTRVALELVQDGTGSRTATWPGTVKWSGGAAPTLTTTATTGTDLISCLYDGTNYLCSANLDLR